MRLHLESEGRLHSHQTPRLPCHVAEACSTLVEGQPMQARACTALVSQTQNQVENSLLWPLSYVEQEHTEGKSGGRPTVCSSQMTEIDLPSVADMGGLGMRHLPCCAGRPARPWDTSAAPCSSDKPAGNQAGMELADLGWSSNMLQTPGGLAAALRRSGGRAATGPHRAERAAMTRRRLQHNADYAIDASAGRLWGLTVPATPDAAWGLRASARGAAWWSWLRAGS